MTRSLAIPFLVLLVAACGSEPTFPFAYDPINIDADADAAGDAADAGDATVDADADVAEDPGADAVEDLGNDAVEDTQPDVPVAGALGEDCERNSECESSICVPVDGDRNVCTDSCAEDACVAGWDCLDEICRCSATLEICDGTDNDCDGEVDEGSSAALGCGGAEVCVAGACVCQSGEECDGLCVDTTVDALNCGGCGDECGGGLLCVDSNCVCPDDFTVCGDICVDTENDAANCDGCGVMCPDGLICSLGDCVCPGEAGIYCESECTDSSSDPANCGGCGIACEQDCVDSDCVCFDGLTPCGGACTDTSDDDLNCGGCGIACGADETCADSECTCRAGLDLCGGECVNTAVDEGNCGVCGTACDPGDVCAAGDCGCPIGLAGCDGGCVDATSDSENCGGCGITCGSDEICDASECVCACPDGACDAGVCIPLASGAAHSLAFSFVAEPQSADIVFNMDTTGSMGDELAGLRSSLSTDIIPLAQDVFADTAFAVTRYDDFPCSPYGQTRDVPFELFQRVTTDIAATQAAVDALGLHNGGDFDESAIESLHQIATGFGQNDCVSGIVPAFDPDDDLIPGVADGTIGGVGFREGAFPIIVHITDAGTHASDGSFPYGASTAEAYSALAGIEARVIGVASGTAARGFLVGVAEATQSRVPVCAWDIGRPDTCEPTECCTAADETGRPPDSDGLCPLVFDIDSRGTGLDRSVVSGIDVLSRFSPFDVVLQTRPDATWLEAGLDTTCLIDSTELLAASDPPGGCGFEAEAADFDGDGANDGATNVTAGTALEFEFGLENSCAPEAGVYPVHFDVQAGSSAVFSTVTVYVVVP